jgi:hypothetical protein
MTRRFPSRYSVARALAAAAFTAAAAMAGACTDTVREGEGSAFLVIDSLTAVPGSSGSSEGSSTGGNTLESDVCIRTGTTGGCGVAEDFGQVTMRLAPKDITAPLSTNNDVTITRYRVQYRRSDGRNTPGVDVPYGFDGAITFTVSESASSATFALVRVQAKLEPPLTQLVNLGGSVAISTIADVTFFGRDQTGREAQVTGSILVTFADWANAPSSSGGGGS